MMTVRQILMKTPPSRKNAAEYVKVKELKALLNKSTGKVTFKAKTLSTHTPVGEKKTYWYTHVSTIELIQGKGAIVSCSCDDFKFVWEYALAKKGAARLEYSNGQPPIDKNPQHIPGQCKHLTKMAEVLISKNRL